MSDVFTSLSDSHSTILGILPSLVPQRLKEAEWIGLPASIAVQKAKAEIKAEKDAQDIPLRDVYKTQFIKRLQSQEFVQDPVDAEYDGK